MVRMIMHGCCGAMGRTITELVKEQEDVVIVAGVDLCGGKGQAYPVYKTLEEVREEADVVVDFAAAAAVDCLLDYCGAKKLPVVLCTTGLSKEQLEKVSKAAKDTAVLRSANMSLGLISFLPLCRRRPGRWRRQALTWRSWRSTTTRKRMPPAARPWLWQILSMRLWAAVTIMRMTGPKGMRSGTGRRSASRR